MALPDSMPENFFLNCLKWQEQFDTLFERPADEFSRTRFDW
jgi:hypothetical protein